ncbi:MAG: cytochrome-c oxidase, cbb3-type subunit II [Candidatus Thiodiazotropha sp. (ex Lucinoma aequizonata)]|nr:cytochrome-c oxidase, cbb3-type subunit II [Candidatus Thiodiazotropha sp. (ex Lucinoma aequizonata)]MCU7889877.1 cytochrome-c oxidase, cbb3-type subunit II [Candidatus Thiodiazotropha sp. (ex Lucinoma aequizonata)]MCU7894405.1 cytochrome-c oxidase, cbb3-type subunit II [Candidatus Thiodiazotropha sp. (ex Lucinoma aequizonata)]MCU7898009.1 cytochrome-c oxidase, cbb3-type subunit II [Candidatus Thiodiazotropha sp. (ex Lucinoma aequizonata)]MCU7903531.1 cytochrome-c oxidase, cbb3-type subunit 
MANENQSVSFQEKMEKNIWLLLILLAFSLSVGGLVEIVPLFTMKSTMEHNAAPELIWQRQASQTLQDHKSGDGMRPYTALELAGRDIYLREGCYTCHSQMVRPFRDEKERYGHYSLASESMYDHPFQWGSKRTGPDFARLGGKYSDDWHRKHLRAPRSVVPESVMPNYPWLKENSVEGKDMAGRFSVMRLIGVPYTDEDIASADAEMAGKTEEDAIVAYLQVLGTMAKLDENKVYRE